MHKPSLFVYKTATYCQQKEKKYLKENIFESYLCI